MQRYEKEISPIIPGWYAVCMRVSPEFNEQFPMAKPQVIYYDGKSDYVCLDPDLPGGGGIIDLEDIVWWGSIVPNKVVPKILLEGGE